MTAFDAAKEYQHWLDQPHLPAQMRDELKSLTDEAEIRDRFGTDLDFGTGGLRGVMGAGLNRMNIYTVRRATAGLALHLQGQGEDAVKAGVAIGYDCRHHSQLFAEIAACTLAAYGIRAYVAPLLCPTPELSWTVRRLQAAAGIMITASHNPPKYNGYKVYNRHGGQLLEADADDIKARMASFSDIFQVPSLTRDEAEAKGLLQTVSANVRAAYVETVVRELRDPRLGDERKQLAVVYTPLHGTGNVPVREALRLAGYERVALVASQVEPNGDFPTVKSPNPEEGEALSLGCQLADEVGADLVMGTDPDADRVGIAARDKTGQLKLLTGNQVGALLVDYMCGRLQTGDQKGQPPIVFKTIVTSDFGRAIAQSHGVAVEETLTGFKYIGDRITAYEASGSYRLLVGYEESYGYLLAPIVRDKDAVQGCLAIAEMTAYHKARGETLFDVLERLYGQFGWYGEKLVNVELSGSDGVERMKRALQALREQPLQVDGLQLMAVEDYLSGERRYVADGKTERLTLPTSDVQKFLFAGGHWAAIRPSGTEPKMKMYVGVRGNSASERDDVLNRIVETLRRRVAD
ncbi:phosphoglucomutase [Alicyclobacillus tengchongensis]|nr:phosphoglucomutase [Alicyclobacillus tengchongensis]